jgi:hypothetical protein
MRWPRMADPPPYVSRKSMMLKESIIIYWDNNMDKYNTYPEAFLGYIDEVGKSMGNYKRKDHESDEDGS